LRNYTPTIFCILFLGDVFRLTTALKSTSKDARRKPLAMVEFVQLDRTHHHADNRSVGVGNPKLSKYRMSLLV